MVHKLSNNRYTHIMKLQYPNLKVTQNGWYSYRRRIPKEVRYLFDGNTEHKLSFKTKDTKLALSLWEQQNRLFDQKIKTHKLLQADVGGNGSSGELPYDLLQQGKLIASQLNQLPSHRPVLRAGATPAERQAFDEAEDIWQTQNEHLTEYVADKYDDGHGGYREPDPRDPAYIAFRIARGELDSQITPKPTLQNLVDHYVERRMMLTPSPTERANKKFETSARRAFKKLAEQLIEGMSTKAEDLVTMPVASILYDLWPNAQTRKKSVNYLKAAITRWNKDNKVHGLDVVNVFESDDIVTKTQLENSVRDRRSLTPNEFGLFLRNVEQIPTDTQANRELRIISYLLAMTATIESETLSLQKNDIVNRNGVVVVYFRANKHRTDNKSRIERAIPLVEPLKSMMLEYLETLAADQVMLFPYYSSISMRGNTALNAQLNSLVVNLHPEDTFHRVSAYSLRHTFVDRADAADVPLDVSYLIEGRQAASDRVRDKYGTSRKAEGLLPYMKTIWATQDWGEYEA